MRLRFFLFLFLSAFFSNNSFSQSYFTWEYIKVGNGRPSVGAISEKDGRLYYGLLFAGNDSEAGVLFSDDNGQTFDRIWASPIEITTLAVGEGSEEVWVGTWPELGGGVFHTTDHGQAWARVIGADSTKTGVADIVVSGNTVFASTTRGIFQKISDDEWQQVGDIGSLTTYDPWLKLVLLDNGMLMGGGSQQEGVFLYTPGGQWERFGLSGYSVLSLERHEDIVMAATSSHGVFRYDLTVPDSGWVAVNYGLPFSEGSHPFMSSLAYASGSWYVGMSLRRSDGVYVLEGGIWSPVNVGLSRGPVGLPDIRVLEPSSDGLWLYTGGSFDPCYKALIGVPTAIGDYSDESAFSSLPTEFALQQNYPNPFNPTTTIQFDIAVASDVQLRIYNMAGQLVRMLVDGEHAPGVHKVVWDARDDGGQRVASGMYVYRIKVGQFTAQRKLMLMK